jgi:hypothetical protein
MAARCRTGAEAHALDAQLCRCAGYCRSASLRLLIVASLRCATRLRQQGIVLLPLYPAFTPAARVARLGPCWAKLVTRLTALSVGVVRWNARAEFVLDSMSWHSCFGITAVSSALIFPSTH